MHTASIKPYILVFAALMILLALTMAASFIPYDHYPRLAFAGVAIALTIAFAKALLVVLYFMHARDASRLTHVFIIAGIFWLAILISLTYSDYLTRGIMPSVPAWTQP